LSLAVIFAQNQIIHATETQTNRPSEIDILSSFYRICDSHCSDGNDSQGTRQRALGLSMARMDNSSLGIIIDWPLVRGV
jgi:hypothetical protein